MPEAQNRRAWKLRAQKTRHEGEMVVLDQNDRLFGRDFARNCVSEALVHGAIVLEVVAPEQGLSVREMAERPQRFVREPVVVAPLLSRRQPNATQHIRSAAHRH
jgi:hypothetical protein